MNDWHKEWEENLKKEGFNYFVLKMEDLFNACDEFQLAEFNDMLKTYNTYRETFDKPVNNYWIVNMDEPYANQVKELIEKNKGVKL